jgi:hypothetical protein
LLLIQLAAWPWPSRALAPLQPSAAQARVVEELAAIPGDVLALEDSYYGRLAGKRTNPDAGAIRCLEYIHLELPEDLVANLSDRRYAAVALSYRVERKDWGGPGEPLNRLIRDNYAFSRALIQDTPEVELLRIPRFIYLPKPDPPAATSESP